MQKNMPPSMRLHLWLENDRGALIGLGRAMLLVRIRECGSLRRAADKLGISYRAAWGKIRQAQEYLGKDLVRKEGKGYVLTDFGEHLADGFLKWHDEVERNALTLAQEHFPWPVLPYRSSPGLPEKCASDSVSTTRDFADKEHL
ncbi:winged helix-turn-helix domain-containing protein [Desulfonatronum thiodismutans]|uniref:winged helix-turn-helix domain-containing protein n=1 Tax=Desulfonatronum thiodismutans TaxID=159290 RepID=UPI000690BA4A|nr:LysR family transcriptional regulator [Desulfonatronum thiodismutans]